MSATDPRTAVVETPPECPSGCGCAWREDADRADCACDGPCCTEEWDALPDGTPRPDPSDLCIGSYDLRTQVGALGFYCTGCGMKDPPYDEDAGTVEPHYAVDSVALPADAVDTRVQQLTEALEHARVAIDVARITTVTARPLTSLMLFEAGVDIRAVLAEFGERPIDGDDWDIAELRPVHHQGGDDVTSPTESDRAAWERLRVPVVVTFARALREGAHEAIEVADDVLTVAHAEGQIQVCEKIIQMLVDEGAGDVAEAPLAQRLAEALSPYAVALHIDAKHAEEFFDDCPRTICTDTRVLLAEVAAIYSGETT